ncbi:hypothetical protein BX616_001346 [Lobosporangium transversale]|uniref:Crinkler effector protein N-terminal domain-containing protein n=1 Tax=Lobosporangium transversale TaxID=64571 RepID=A0A1Y2GTU9_9FUNG|nr:hypothetical protein BCR41DRAFT_36678 [Lobosporangium transversale]KAF9904291.1 hypothetical protein BX616_001346 [Lobosporangium transversale]ORZ20160.1 hypothetical protein BCR41DRAFT_36678 [Lobosporangium transversale]|eukprot:XP_021882700.1 hypothetical protein BCR41DRAFT_36678 [Lobosporangium transversale]
MLSLSCIFNNNPASCTVSVIISPESTVFDLRNELRQLMPELCDIDPNLCALWRLCIPISGNKVSIENVSTKIKMNLLAELGEVFPQDSSEDLIHVLVDIVRPEPSLRLNMTLRTDPKKNPQWSGLLSTITQAILIDAICEEYPNMPRTPNPPRIMLYPSTDNQSSTPIPTLIESDPQLKSRLSPLIVDGAINVVIGLALEKHISSYP